MLDALAKVIAKILVDLLQYIQAREDLKNLVRAEMELAGLKDANEAIGWKASALATADGGATLVVRDGALQISIPGYSTNPGSLTITPSVPPGPPDKDVPPAAG